MDEATGTTRRYVAVPAYTVSTVAVGYANGTFLLAWTQAGMIEAIRVTPAGIVLDATLPIGTGPTSLYGATPALAAAGGTLFASWEEQVGAPSAAS